MKLTKMEKKGIIFACVNTATERKDLLLTYIRFQVETSCKFKDVSIIEKFSSAISAHKDKPVIGSKTPENSSKA